MNNYVGIDLGTTNSAISSYDGSEIQGWKSPEQNDVTPSAIYIDRRGNRYFGRQAYDQSAQKPDNAATLFKRHMGTSTPINLSAVDVTMTPEECSAEILKVLYGYLPEEIRNDPETGTVITVPAAFNQMQKDATMQAAEMAGIGKVALMQEPVAAVMSVVRAHNSDGMFLIYDLGGGTLDIAIAESTPGRINLLAHGGIAMCGGRDFDRDLVDNVVRPWLQDNFNLPADFSINPTYKRLIRMAYWATERAKIELSSKEEAFINLTEDEARIEDIDGEEIYLSIPIQRETLDNLIAERIDQSIQNTRETLKNAHLSTNDMQRIVFIGGPTHYKPLRDKVCFELGLEGSTKVNPMTAVSAGASIFAESVDWSTKRHSRKSSRGRISSSSKLDLAFSYVSRTSDVKAKIGVQMEGAADTGSEVQIDSVDSGWSSGRLPLRHGAIIEVNLPNNGDNTFKVFVFDPAGGAISLDEDRIVITRTAATVDSIPASHSVAAAALDRLGGSQVLDYWVKAGDPLPCKGNKTYRAADTLKAGATESLNINLWEGDIENPITDNRPIGSLKITGSDFDDGVIPAGAELVCDYQILDSGQIMLEVSVPSIGGSFSSEGKNFYSRQGGLRDFTSVSTARAAKDEGESTQRRIDDISQTVDDPRLQEAQQKLTATTNLNPDETDPETNKQAWDNVYDARKLLAKVRAAHLKETRQMDLNGVVSFFNQHVRQYARSSEETSFDNLTTTAQTAIDNNASGFEQYLDDLKGRNFEILWRQDWFAIEKFKWMANAPHQFTDHQRFNELVQLGTQLMRDDDIDKLREVIRQLASMQVGGASDSEILESANIIRGD